MSHMQDLIGVVAAALLLCSARAGVPQDYKYPVLWNPSTIVASNISYTDGPANLRVHCAADPFWWLWEHTVGEEFACIRMLFTLSAARTGLPGVFKH